MKILLVLLVSMFLAQFSQAKNEKWLFDFSEDAFPDTLTVYGNKGDSFIWVMPEDAETQLEIINEKGEEAYQFVNFQKGMTKKVNRLAGKKGIDKYFQVFKAKKEGEGELYFSYAFQDYSVNVEICDSDCETGEQVEVKDVEEYKKILRVFRSGKKRGGNKNQGKNSTNTEPKACCKAYNAKCLACSEGISVKAMCKKQPELQGCKTEEPRICCEAYNAKCMACSEGISVKEMCKKQPDLSGCDTTEEPKACCRAYNAKCLACSNGITEEEMCKKQPELSGCDTEPRMCCMAMISSCLACSEGISEKEYCKKYPDVQGCEDILQN